MPLFERKHEHHEKHLCSYVTWATLDEYRPLVRNAAFVCKQCGRAAAKAENLCDPVAL
jgi:hypothetical protein